MRTPHVIDLSDEPLADSNGIEDIWFKIGAICGRLSISVPAIKRYQSSYAADSLLGNVRDSMKRIIDDLNCDVPRRVIDLSTCPPVYDILHLEFDDAKSAVAFRLAWSE